MKKKISITLDPELLEATDRLVDNLIIRNRSQAIEYVLRKTLSSHRTAVILCGGNEEQLRINEEEYRPTVKVGELTVIERAVNKLKDNKFTNIYVIARNKILTKVFEILKDGAESGVKINYVEEKASRGTAESLKLLKGKINEKMLVVYGDIVFDRINIEALWAEQEKHDFVATLLLTTSAEFSEKGAVYVEGNRITSFIQKPKESENYIVFSPIFIAEPDLLSIEGNSLEKDVFPRMAEKGILGGYLSSEKEIHIHSVDDAKRLGKK